MRRYCQRKNFNASTKLIVPHSASTANSGSNGLRPVPCSMTPRSASLSAVRGSACTNGWIAAGKRSVEKQIHEAGYAFDGTRARGDEQSQAAEGQGAKERNGREEQQRTSKRHAERKARKEQEGSGFRNQENQPRGELRAKQMAFPDGRRYQSLQKVAVSCDHQREADAPREPGSVTCALPAVNASARPAACCNAASTANRAARLSGWVGSYE